MLPTSLAPTTTTSRSSPATSANRRPPSVTSDDLRDGAEILRRLVEALDQRLFERRADERAAAESHDRHAGRHAAAIGEPANQRADRRNIAQPQAAAADDAVAEIHEPELVQIDAEPADQIAAAPARGRHGADHARADVLEPLAGERRREPEKDNRDREGLVRPRRAASPRRPASRRRARASAPGCRCSRHRRSRCTGEWRSRRAARATD